MASAALEELFVLEEAYNVCSQRTSPSDTLTVVTADHSHAFAFGGYPSRGENVLDKASVLAKDQKPYTYLLYANGPNGLVNTSRSDISGQNTSAYAKCTYVYDYDCCCFPTSNLWLVSN
jgi:alkaline phosphatase